MAKSKQHKRNLNWFRSNKMTQKKKNDPVVTIDGKEYPISKMTDDQKKLVAHLENLENKINNTQFNMDELVGGHTHFYTKLKDSLG